MARHRRETARQFDRAAAEIEGDRALRAEQAVLSDRLAELQLLPQVPVTAIRVAWLEHDLRKLGAKRLGRGR